MSTRLLILPVVVLAAAPAAAGAAPARDRDRDGLPDRWERQYHVASKRADPDHDRLTNLREYRLRINPRKADTDRDGLRDGAEVLVYRTSPRRRDTDRDGVSDGAEVKAHTNPRKATSKPATGTPTPGSTSHPTSGTATGAATGGGTGGTGTGGGGTGGGGSTGGGGTGGGTGGAGGPVGPQPETFTCDRSATTGTFSSEVSASTPGQTICLASGSYGTWSGTNKAITVRGASGASATVKVNFTTGDAGFTLSDVTIPGGDVTNGAKNITIRNSTFTSHLRFDNLANSNILLDHNSHNNISGNGGAARLHFTWGSGSTHSGVTIQNSLLSGGDSDGIQTGAGVNVINNEFLNVINTGGSSNHTDNIQFYGGGTGSVIRGNWVHQTVSGEFQGIAAYDGVQNLTIEDNVVQGRRQWLIELYADKNSVVRHNTVVWQSGNCRDGSPCGYIDVSHKSGDPASQGTQVYDNVAAVDMNDTQGGSAHHNVSGANVSYLGPLTSWAGYQLAAGSAGKGAASDGLDVGIRP